MAGSYVQRRLSFTITLAPRTDSQGNATRPTFDGKNDQVTLAGYRASAHVIKAGGPAMGTCDVRIYGLPLKMMNQLSTLGLVLDTQPRNIISVSAGDDQNGMTQIFSGTIKFAWADFNGAPDVVFNLSAYTGLAEAMAPMAPSSYAGATDVATILKGLADQLGLGFENHGVNVQLVNPYLPSTGFRQIEACADAAGINWVVDDHTLAIWPRSGSRDGTIPLISPDTGMVGYPVFDQQGIILTTLYNPGLRYGSRIKVQSSMTPACGEWVVYTLQHDLEAETPNGKWFSQVLATAPGYVPVV